jgi:hypothetical protein
MRQTPPDTTIPRTLAIRSVVSQYISGVKPPKPTRLPRIWRSTGHDAEDKQDETSNQEKHSNKVKFFCLLALIESLGSFLGEVADDIKSKRYG